MGAWEPGHQPQACWPPLNKRERPHCVLSGPHPALRTRRKSCLNSISLEKSWPSTKMFPPPEPPREEGHMVMELWATPTLLPVSTYGGKGGEGSQTEPETKALWKEFPETLKCGHLHVIISSHVGSCCQPLRQVCEDRTCPALGTNLQPDLLCLRYLSLHCSSLDLSKMLRRGKEEMPKRDGLTVGIHGTTSFLARLASTPIRTFQYLPGPLVGPAL